MADFKQAYAITKEHEGGYANDPDDRGGETYKGISRKNWPKWEGWKLIDESTRNIPVSRFNEVLAKSSTLQAMVLTFYKELFWDDLKLDAVNSQAIANELFDTSVNMGQGTAAKFVQEAINLTTGSGLTIDGKIGPQTLTKINGYASTIKLVRLLNVLQGERYLYLLRKDPSQAKFANSWLSRTV